MRHARTAFLAALACWISTTTAIAAPPTVESVVPGVGQIGRAFDVVLSGGRLKDAREILWYDEGLSCTRLEAVSDNEARATLRSRPGARPGAYAFRVRTNGGLSELKVVHLVPSPLAAESEPNDDPGRAQLIPLNSSVAGVIDAGDVDCFGVAMRKGQRLSAEVQAVRLGGEMTDAVLSIFAPDGRRIVEVDDTPLTRQDPFASVIAEVDGVHVIAVRDTGFGGGPSNAYALHVGEFPRPTGVFPPGGPSGKPTRLRLLGLDGGGAFAEVTPPSDGGPWWDYFPSIDGRTAPTPIPIRVRPYDGLEEADPGEAAPPPDRPDVRDWPVAFHGVIGGRGDVDAFAIRARAGQAIQVEVFAARLGSPLDAILRVYDPDGDLVGVNDDDATHDSRLAFRALADGPYRVEIRDKRLEGGPGFVYRIEVEAPRPSLTLFLAGPARKSQARQAIAVPRGNRVLAHLGVRRDGFRGPVRIEPGPLPAGVSIDLGEIPDGSYLTPVVIEAAADAPMAAGLVALRGIAETPAGTVTGDFAQVVDLLPGEGDSSFESIRVDKLAMAVVQEAPYTVSLAPTAGPIARDGSIEVLAKVTRAGGFDEAMEVSLPYLPPGVEMDGPAIVPPDRGEAALHLLARPDADPASWRLAAEARPAPPRRDRREMTLALMAQLGATGGGRRRRPAVEGRPEVASRFVPLELGPAPVAGRLEPAVAEQGRPVTIACALEHERPLPAPMLATLEGLPPRASASTVPVSADAHRIEFRVAVAPGTSAGRFDGLAVRLSGESGGRPFTYRIARGGRLEIYPAGALLTGRDGKPMSPLDALRAREAAPAKRSPGPGRDHPSVPGGSGTTGPMPDGAPER